MAVFLRWGDFRGFSHSWNKCKVERDEVFCNALMYRLTETQQRSYVLPGGGNTPIYYWAATVEWRHTTLGLIYFFIIQTRRLRLYISVVLLLTKEDVLGKSKQIITVHTFIKSKCIYCDYFNDLFLLWNLLWSHFISFAPTQSQQGHLWCDQQD